MNTENVLYQDISSMQKRYQGKWNCAMLAYYYWTWARDALTMEYKQQEKWGGGYLILCVLNNNLHEKDSADVQFML